MKKIAPRNLCQADETKSCLKVTKSISHYCPQNFLIAIIVGAMVDFVVGTIMGPKDATEIAQGFVGWSSKFFFFRLEFLTYPYLNN